MQHDNDGSGGDADVDDGGAGGARVYADDGGFAAIPRWLQKSGVSPRAYMLYGVLTGYAAMRDGARPSLERLAGDLSCSVATVKRARTELVNVGALTLATRYGTDGRQLPSHYVVRWSPVDPGSPVDGGGGHPWTGGEVTGEPGKRPTRERPTRKTRADVVHNGGDNGKADTDDLDGTGDDLVGRVPVLPGITPPDDDDDVGEVDRQFAAFWDAYPPTNGVKRERARARDQFAALDVDDRRRAYRGAVNVYVHWQATGEIPRYAFRFLRDRTFDEFQRPIVVDRATGEVRQGDDPAAGCRYCGQPANRHDDRRCPNHPDYREDHDDAR